MKSKQKMFKLLSLRILVILLISAISGPALAQSQTLLSITVTPTNPTITVGQTQQFTATGTFSDGSTQLLTMQPPSGLVSWWPGDGNANDVIGVNNGTLMNGATFAPGMVGQAFSFDGVDDYVDVGNSASLKMTDGLTISAWIKMATFSPVYQNIISDHAPNEVTEGPGKILRFHFNTLEFIVDGIYGFGTAIYVKYSFDNTIMGKWEHVVGTYDRNTVRLYLNGVEVDSRPHTAPLTVNSNPIFIGKSGFGEYLNGMVDEAEIYNRALTATEIQAIFNAGTLGKCKSQSNCVTWSSSNPAVATIDTNGLTTGNSLGTSTITATSGTISGSTTLTVAGADTTPPVITPTITPAPNAAGWSNSNVTVSWSVTDPESGISSSSGCTSTSLITETSGTVLTCVATNGAGLSNSAFVTIRIDKTPPVISASSSPLPNGAGWNNTNVTVSYTCTDSLSGISSCSGPTTVTTEGTGQVIAGSAMDLAGNSAATSVTLNIDKTAPVVAITGVTNGATYTLGCAPTANFTATDTLSGVATSNGSLTGGNNGVGAFTYTASATDVAGNSTTQKANYSVVYNFIGFLQPINSDGSSIFKLGSAIPIKYQLTDCNGVAVTTSLGTLAVFKITDAVLGTTEEVTVDSVGTANTDNLFRYSAPNYIYNLDTKPYTSGTYRLQAILDDGTIRSVNVSLKVK